MNSNAPRFLNNGNDDRDLALKMYWGRVLQRFYNATRFYDRTNSVIAYQKVTSGKSWQFIQVADGPEAEYHQAGTELLGQNYAFDEGTITVDDPIVAHKDVPGDQTRMAHFPSIAPLASQNGRKIAEFVDIKLAITGVLAARTAAKNKTVNGQTFNVHQGGNVVERVGASGVASAYPTTVTGAQNFRRDVYELGRLMDEDSVPEEGRFLYILPYIEEVLLQDTTIFSKDFSNLPGDIARKAFGRIGNFTLIKTNHLPSDNITTGPTKYQGDFRYNGAVGQPAALALCGASEGNAAIGMVEADGLAGEMHWDWRRRTTFLFAGTAVGMGVLSPFMAGEIRVTAA